MPRLVHAVVFAALLALPAFAHAKDMSGTLGVGASTSISGTPSAHGQYWVTDAVGLQATIALASFTSSDDTIPDQTVFLLGVGAIYNLIQHSDINLGGYLSFALAAGDASLTQIGLGLRPEWFVSDHLSFHTQIGLTILVVGADSASFLPEGTVINLFGNGGLVGTAGFSFYF